MTEIQFDIPTREKEKEKKGLRFAIRPTSKKAIKEGDYIVRYSGVSEPFNQVSDRYCRKLGVASNGDNILKFVTGMEVDQVAYYSWYNQEEKKAVEEQIKELAPIIEKAFGGKEVVDPTNSYFWLDNRAINRLSLSNESSEAFFDTSKPEHALLYLSIMAGAFIDLVAPTLEWAESNHIYNYMVMETEDYNDSDEDITKSDAHAMLSELRKEESGDALFIIAWCAQYDTNAFGGINKATPVRTLVQTHIQFIDGKLVSKKKRNMPATFIDYAVRWKGQQTRPALYAEAYIKAGEYFNFINQKGEKRYTTADGTSLGNTISEAVTTIMKPKFRSELEKLRDDVERKWNS